MIVKVRYNFKHFNLPPHATADRVPVLDDRNTTLPWLGYIDRRIARQIPDAKQVAIAVTGWVTCECGKWEWVPA